MKVIMNADDFGFSKGANLGILEGFQNGIISSTSLMVNMPGFAHAISLMEKFPDRLHVGIHLVTTVEYAICKDLKTLTDETGHFYHDSKKVANCDPNEILREYQAQMDRFLSTGQRPDHIDFHYCHTPVQVWAGIQLAKKYNLPMRAGNKDIETLCEKEGVRYAPNHISDFYNQGERHTDVETMLGLLKTNLEEGRSCIEFAVHPAYVDLPLLTLSSYNVQRATELAVLLDPAIMEYIRANDIQLVSFNEIE